MFQAAWHLVAGGTLLQMPSTAGLLIFVQFFIHGMVAIKVLICTNGCLGAGNTLYSQHAHGGIYTFTAYILPILMMIDHCHYHWSTLSPHPVCHYKHTMWGPHLGWYCDTTNVTPKILVQGLGAATWVSCSVKTLMSLVFKNLHFTSFFAIDCPLLLSCIIHIESPM